MRALVLALVLPACRNAAKDPVTEPLSETGLVDADGDGYGEDEDCDDENSGVHPGVAEICDGIDNDCDGTADEDVTDTFYADADGDGFGSEAAPLDACEAPAGYAAVGSDCDDEDPDTYPGAPERCDSVDNDCDGAIDEDLVASWYADADGDGYGDAAAAIADCDPGEGYVADNSDCDDTDPAAFPGGTEVCDEADNDCDGAVDEDATTTYYADTDGDGFGADGETAQSCDPLTGYAAVGGDCDDAEAGINPGEAEVCDGADNDCDGQADEGLTALWHADADGDGFGDPGAAVVGCDLGAGYAADDTDCDDGDSAINPGAAEVCDGADNDCDGQADEAGAAGEAASYADADGDGYGDSAEILLSCEQPAGYSAEPGDCDDADPGVYPGAEEICDGLDNDCDGSGDDELASTFYADKDGDGYGDEGAARAACDLPAGYSAEPGDCDDGDPAANPGVAEVCDGVDNDCDGEADEGLKGTFYLDADGDGYGDGAGSVEACDRPAGAVEDDADCDDADAAVYPGAAEICDGADSDCDGALSAEEADEDGDGYDLCADQDCDDADAGVGPGGDSDGDGEVDCYDADDDGDGASDEDEETGDACGFTTDPYDPDTDGDGALDGADAAPTIAACADTLYFCDGFQGDPAAGWSAVSGLWSWDGGDTYASVNTTSGAVTWIGAESWTDYVVEVRMRPDHGSGDPGFLFRSQSVSAVNDGGAHYYLGLYPGDNRVTLGYMNGTWNPFANAGVTIDPGVWYTVQAQVSGSSFLVYLDGALLFSASNAVYGSGGVGLRTYQSPATYDYVLVCD